MSQPTYPLTDFILKLPTVDRQALAKADPDKLAAKYRINPDHARGYIAFQMTAGR